MTGTALTWPDVEAAAERGGWKRSGGEWHGPCPRCGGTRRAWVRPGSSTAVVGGCHHCDVTGLDVAADLAGVELGRRSVAFRRRAQEPARAGGGRSSDADEADRGVLAAAVWSAAGPVLDSPGRTYLQRRLGRFEDEHDAVRWLDAAGCAAVELRPQLPTAAAGVLLYAFTDGGPGDVRAVQLEAIAAEPWPATVGGRVEVLQRVAFDRAGKRPSVKGSDFGAGSRTFRAAAGDAPVVLVEGPLDSLGLAALWPGADVRGVAGAGAIPAAAVAVLEDVGLERHIVVAADRDVAGDGAAVRAAVAVRAKGGHVEIRTPKVGTGDWSDVAESVAVVEAEHRRAEIRKGEHGHRRTARRAAS